MKLKIQTKYLRWVAVAAIAGFTLLPVAGRAEDQSELIQKLLNRIDLLEKKVGALESGQGSAATSAPPADAVAIQELNQKLRVLERKRELDQEATAEAARTATVASMGAGGFQIRSADTNFAFRVRGNIQADARFFLDDPNGVVNDSFLLRRVRPTFEGTVWGKYDFRVTPDFAPSTFTLQDAYADLRFSPYFGVLAGKTKSPFGLERLVSQTSMLFVERGLPTHLAPNRDVGFQAHGSLFDGRLDYAVAVLNGTPDNGVSVTDLDDDKEFAARLFSHPFKNSKAQALRGLGIGVAGTYGNKSGTVPANYLTVNQQTFFSFNNGVVNNGTHWRLGPQAYYYYGPFGLLAEYTISSQALRLGPPGGVTRELKNTAWQVAVSYALTGESASYRGVTPAKNFDLSAGTWGAFEIAARYGELDIDNAAFTGGYANPAQSATEARSAGIGLNWYLNRNVKATVNYNWTGFDGPVTAPGRIASQDEQAIFSRVQLSF